MFGEQVSLQTQNIITLETTCYVPTYEIDVKLDIVYIQRKYYYIDYNPRF